MTWHRIDYFRFVLWWVLFWKLTRRQRKKNEKRIRTSGINTPWRFEYLQYILVELTWPLHISQIWFTLGHLLCNPYVILNVCCGYHFTIRLFSCIAADFLHQYEVQAEIGSLWCRSNAELGDANVRTEVPKGRDSSSVLNAWASIPFFNIFFWNYSCKIYAICNMHQCQWDAFSTHLTFKMG